MKSSSSTRTSPRSKQPSFKSSRSGSSRGTESLSLTWKIRFSIRTKSKSRRASSRAAKERTSMRMPLLTSRPSAKSSRSSGPRGARYDSYSTILTAPPFDDLTVAIILNSKSCCPYRPLSGCDSWESRPAKLKISAMD